MLRLSAPLYVLFFFFNDPATTDIYTLSLHDALPICRTPTFSSRSRSGIERSPCPDCPCARRPCDGSRYTPCRRRGRSEEHTSELQSRRDLVCRLLLEKKKKKRSNKNTISTLITLNHS